MKRKEEIAPEEMKKEGIAIKFADWPRLAAFQRDIRSAGKTYLKIFWILLAVHVIGISAIIRANVSYLDDVGRIAFGHTSFGFGRKLADLIAIFVHTAKSLRDVSPLTQLLAACFLSAACCVVISLLSEKPGINFWTIAAVVPLGLSPYFLECLSYKFDAPYMALSILVSVLPFLFLKYGLLPYSAASLAGCLSMCTLYQSSSGIYPMLTALLCFHQWNKGRPIKDVLRFCLVSAFNYCFALVIFRGLFAPAPDAQNYVNHAVSLSKFPENLRTYFSLIRSDFKSGWLVLVVLIAVSFVYISARDTVGRPRVLSGLLAAVTLLVMLSLSYGAYGVFEKPPTAPRGMYGFGVFIAFAGVYVSSAKWIYPAKLACFCLSWAFVIFALVYGNALEENQRYLEFRVESAIRDVCETEAFRSLDQSDEKIYFQYYGSISGAPILLSRNDNSTYLLSRLVPNIVTEDWSHGQNYIRWYFGIGHSIIIDYSEDFRDLDLPILKDTFYHTIRGDSERILIEFKR